MKIPPPQITRAAVATLVGLLFATATLAGSATGETVSRSVEVRPTKAALKSAAQLREQALASDEALLLVAADGDKVESRKLKWLWT